jgi:hypothetical protein
MAGIGLLAIVLSVAASGALLVLFFFVELVLGPR